MTRLGLILAALILSGAALAEEAPLIPPPGVVIVTDFGPEGAPLGYKLPNLKRTKPTPVAGQREPLGPTISK